MESPLPEGHTEDPWEFLLQHQKDTLNLQTQMVDIYNRFAASDSRSESRFTSLEARMDAKFEALTHSINRLSSDKGKEKESHGLLPTPESIVGSSSAARPERYNPWPNRNLDEHNGFLLQINRPIRNEQQPHFQFSKLEFLKFQGEDVKGWLKRCTRFFQLNPIPEESRVAFASIYLEAKADH